ncbi:cytochrome c oxidase assembly protein COX16-domain-containing protein [Hygrophoropsis aurantiaca]|uniref:Cytochrome c oxidase assembly protein COX16-domain-containing protein n=1 Tax=Hygrophoropsis aurantiaca TaxID=72124 RepID=A0ACB8A685_9AGAM|nr:cytochrome c oxidase assembly protein COX16-domain-containing protein [Hygrophoropsis aurantiaca]
MPTFSSNPTRTSPLHSTLKRHPALFGVPFVLIIVGASFGLQSFTQTRYDLQDQKVKQFSNEQALGLDRRKKKFDIREEYYKLSASTEEDWEPRRIARPKGVPEWGVPPSEPSVSKS